MDVIIDTNILSKDFKLLKHNIKELEEYLKKTNGKLVIPQIVIEEVKEVFERQLRDSLKTAESAQQQLERFGYTFKLKSHDELVLEYDLFLKDLVKREYVEILPYKNEYLPEVINRANKRIKPCNSSGEGFKDVIIWLSLIDRASTKQKTCSFISDNVYDFAAEDKATLHPALIDDCSNAAASVLYFRSVRDFIDSTANLWNHLEKEWLLSKFSENEVIKFVTSKLYPQYEKQISVWYERYMDVNFCLDNKEFVSILGFTGDGSVEFVEAFSFKSESEDMQIRSIFTIMLETEIEIVEYEDGRSTTTDTDEIEIKVSISSVLKDDKLTDHQLDEWWLPNATITCSTEGRGYSILKRSSWGGKSIPNAEITVVASMIKLPEKKLKQQIKNEEYIDPKTGKKTYAVSMTGFHSY